MTAIEILALLGAGLAAGIFNTVAGGGSLITVPLLIFLGIPATIANATTRPAIVAQSALAVFGFKRTGAYALRVYPASAVILGILMIPGAVVGAAVAATRIDDRTFELLLSAVLVLVALVTWRRRQAGRGDDPSRPPRPGTVAVLFFALGFYGGFIQAGIGFLMMAVLLNATGWPVGHINAVKVLVVLIYMTAAVIVFAIEGAIVWSHAAVLIIGQAAGGYLGSLASMRLSGELLLRVYVVLLLVFAATLVVN